jgi:hypothetical protein
VTQVFLQLMVGSQTEQSSLVGFDVSVDWLSSHRSRPESTRGVALSVVESVVEGVRVVVHFPYFCNFRNLVVFAVPFDRGQVAPQTDQKLVPVAFHGDYQGHGVGP